MTEMDNWLFGLAIGFMIGILCGAIIGGIVKSNSVLLKQEVADDICRQLTNDPTAIAKETEHDGRGRAKLLCELPSFDETQNIIIKINSE